MIPYYTGAVETGAPQRDPAASTGGFRSGSRFHSLAWDTPDPLIGIAIRGVGGGNGAGVGTLSAASADTVTWTPPGGTAGDAVEVAYGEEIVARGAAPGSWIRLARVTENALSGVKSVILCDRLNNLFADVESADAVAGLATIRALMLLNDLGAATAFEAWVGEGNIEIDLEEPTGGELLGSGLSWSGATTEGAGPGLASVADGGEVGVWIRRTIAADSEPSPGDSWEVRFSFTVGAVDYTGGIRGMYRVERDDYEMEGIWVAVDGYPDFDAAPDETWTSRPHTTSLGLTGPATIRAAIRSRNRWGVWGVSSEVVDYPMDGSGDTESRAPSGPTDVTAFQTSGNKPSVGASYDAAVDGDNQGAIWVVWIETDGTDPDGSATPAGYEVMRHNQAVQDLAWNSDGDALDDGTPIRALVRVRRLDNAGGTAFSPDVIQLDDSDPGTLKVDDEISDWPSSGYASVTTRFGKLIEVVHYSGISVAAGQTTVTVDERGLWGTTATATNATHIVTPVVAVDSENTATASWEVVAVAPGRPLGSLLYGEYGGQFQAPVTAPDVGTPVVLNADENVHLLLGEGTASLMIDTTLVWRALMNGDSGEDNGLYIPSEFAVVNEDISGAAVDEGVIDAVDEDTVYVAVRGQRRLLIDLDAMEIRVGTLALQESPRQRAEQAGQLGRFGSTLFLVWDPEREDWRPYLEIDSDGLFTSALPVIQDYDAAEVAALWQA